MKKIVLISALVIIVFTIATLHFTKTLFVCPVTNDQVLSIDNQTHFVVYKKTTFEYGDLVCFRFTNDKTIHIQRIVGFEGDTIELNDGVLLRNGFLGENPKNIKLNYFVKRWALMQMPSIKTFAEKLYNDTLVIGLTYYQRDTLSRNFRIRRFGNGTTRNFNPIIVPKGHCFVLADNRDGAKDSRHFGCIPISYIIGTVIK